MRAWRIDQPTESKSVKYGQNSEQLEAICILLSNESHIRKRNESKTVIEISLIKKMILSYRKNRQLNTWNDDLTSEYWLQGNHHKRFDNDQGSKQITKLKSEGGRDVDRRPAIKGVGNDNKV